jgi:TPR repeat protein
MPRHFVSIVLFIVLGALVPATAQTLDEWREMDKKYQEHEKNAPSGPPASAEAMLRRANLYLSVGNDVGAFRLTKQAAEMGNVNAQVGLAILYLQGRGVEKNPEEALKLLLQSADRNEVQAYYLLGDMYAKGLEPGGRRFNPRSFYSAFRPDPKSEQEALNWYQKAAEGGFASGQFTLGNWYATGRVVRQSDAKAAEWYEKAAAQGHKEAQEILTRWYKEHRVKNPEESILMWMLVKHWGKCLLFLALCFWLGKYRLRPFIAVHALQKKANAGDALAQLCLGIKYITDDPYLYEAKLWIGEIIAAQRCIWYAERRVVVDRQPGFDKEIESWQAILAVLPTLRLKNDNVTAVAWIKKSARQKNSLALFLLGYMYMQEKYVPRDERKAAIYYQEAATQGSVFAAYELGHLYEQGRGVPKNADEAFKWHLAAAQEKHPVSLFQAGLCYMEGKTVEKDIKKAQEYFKESAKRGYAGAYAKLGMCYLDEGMRADAYKWLLVFKDDIGFLDLELDSEDALAKHLFNNSVIKGDYEKIDETLSACEASPTEMEKAKKFKEEWVPILEYITMPTNQR